MWLAGKNRASCEGIAWKNPAETFDLSFAALVDDLMQKKLRTDERKILLFCLVSSNPVGQLWKETQT